MRLNDFLDVQLLGDEFLALNGYTPVTDHETGEIVAYHLDISLQDEHSKFYYKMIKVKVKTLQPEVEPDAFSQSRTIPVILEDLQMGQFNGNLWFVCNDVKYAHN